VRVLFSTANTSATPTLNVNSTGAKQIRSHTGAALTAGEYGWAANSVLDLVYDGTYWRMQDSGAIARVSQSESSITQLADSITSLVSNGETYTAPDGTTKTNSLHTAIEQNASAIALKADASTTYTKEAVNNLVDESSDLAYDHSWSLSNGTYTFTATLRKAGEDVSSLYASECFVWYLRGEDGDRLWARGPTMTIPASAAGMRGSVLGGFYEATFKGVVTSGGTQLVDSNGNEIVALMPE
jgi:hypothetical protein